MARCVVLQTAVSTLPLETLSNTGQKKKKNLPRRQSRMQMPPRIRLVKEELHRWHLTPCPDMTTTAAYAADFSTKQSTRLFKNPASTVSKLTANASRDDSAHVPLRARYWAIELACRLPLSQIPARLSRCSSIHANGTCRSKLNRHGSVQSAPAWRCRFSDTKELGQLAMTQKLKWKWTKYGVRYVVAFQKNSSHNYPKGIDVNINWYITD